MTIAGPLAGRFGRPLAGVLLVACVFWLLLLVLLPLTSMMYESIRPNIIDAGPLELTFSNYERLLTSDIHRVVFLRTIWGSALVTLVSLLLCYPIAFILAKISSPATTRVVFLALMIPFWVSEVLRTYTWFVILAYQGVLNRVLISLGVISEPVRWLSGSSGVIVGMIYAFILFMIFPILSAMQSLDREQLDAAEDLGASVWQKHRQVVIPHAKPGIAAGCILVFVSAASSYAAPAILGAPGTRWFTEIIYEWFFEGQNWPQGAAYAFVLLALCLATIIVTMRIFKVGMADMAR